MSSRQAVVDDAVLENMMKLQLSARRAVEGMMAGLHRSLHHGTSVEYKDHRAYAPGDELRHMDWKLLGRTDKRYIKLYEDETSLRTHLVVDASRSMSYASGEISKFDYACQVAAAVAFVLHRQRDAIGLTLYDAQARTRLPSKSTPSQFARIVESLASSKPDNESSLGGVLHELAQQIPRRGLVVILSDLIDDEEKVERGLQHLRHRGHDVIVFQIMDRAELELPFTKMSQFRDMEGSGKLNAHPKIIRQRYLDNLNAFMIRVREACHRWHVDHHLAVTDQPSFWWLGPYLKRRAQGG